MEKKCPKCGVPMQGDTCKYCGYTEDPSAVQPGTVGFGAKPKKKFYKKWWFWVIVVIVLGIAGASGGKSDDKSTDDTEVVETETTEETPEEEVAQEDSAEEDTEASAEVESTFVAKDVSDATIESIVTYGDYLAMYKKITEDYYANYESAIKGTVLYDEATFQQLKDENDKAFAEQEEQYGSMKNQALVGKDELVNYLKQYRDSLKQSTDAIKESLEGM